MVCTPAAAAAPRVLPAGQLPSDTRLGPLQSEEGDFSFAPAASPDEWQQRSAEMRRIMRVALGLWPMPTRTPLNAVIHGRRDFGDYSVEKVYLESVPGFFVTGNLYRPTGHSGKRPGVLSPHGHFPLGRFQDNGRDAVRRQIVQGAERFEDGGRSVMQSRCVQLARMGCVVFHYDMVGYGDCRQLSEELLHRFARSRVKYNVSPPSGFYSAQAELRLQNVMGLHTYNSIRALDFLVSLPDVDPQRIAVTGASGGGTQTFMLCAVDDRPLVSAPVVIVSTTRQGGCTCENICGLRIGTYNLEFTALHAPKPLLLVSADDATRTMPQRGFPELKRHYQVLGAGDNVSHAALLHFPHNYNHVSRAAMYHWLNKHLRLGLEEPILEQSYQRLTREELTVWDAEHPQPSGGPETERKLLDWLAHDSDRQLAELFPRDPESLERYRAVVGTAWKTLIRGLPEDSVPSWHETAATQRGNYLETLGLLRYRSTEGHEAELPCVRLSPAKPGGRMVVWIDDFGKSALYRSDGSIQPHIARLLEAGASVVGVDLLYQGEFLASGKPLSRQRWLEGEEAFAGWTYCYNLPVAARRAHDILAVIQMCQRESPSTALDLVGLGPAGVWAALALAQSGAAVDRAAIDTQGFRFASLSDVYDINFLPGAVKYGDLPGLLALAAPTRLWLAGEGARPPLLVAAAYAAAGKSDGLIVPADGAAGAISAAVEWLVFGNEETR